MMSSVLATVIRSAVLFTELNGRGRKDEEFTTPQSTTNQKSKDGVVAFAPKTIPVRVQQQRPVLIGSEPIAQWHAGSAYALDSTDAAASSGLSKPESAASYATRLTAAKRVDRCWSEMALFQVDPVSKNNRAIESKSWFRAVPVDELVDRMIVRPLATFRSQAVQYGRLRLFEIRKC